MASNKRETERGKVRRMKKGLEEQRRCVGREEEETLAFLPYRIKKPSLPDKDYLEF